jgi:uncharacterized membrane protein
MSTAVPNPGSAASLASGRRTVVAHPAVGLVLLSAVFGSVIIAVTPPLRGPDETAHFLRAYGIAQGDVVPSIQDDLGRKGIFLPAAFHRDFSLFDRWQSTGRGEGVPFEQVIDAFRQRPVETEVSAAESTAVFVAYAGSEGYSPAAYLPQAAAALLARAAGLGFVATFYLMRLAGLALMTAVVAYAVTRTPVLKWAFVTIAMLPSALYARAVINADAAAFAFGLVVVAAFLRAVSGSPMGAPGTRSGWMLLCVLSKPPNLAFMLLEWLRPQTTGGWRVAAVATFPALAAALVWSAVSSADVAAWRLVELTGTAAQEFNPGWKLHFMLAHPLEFPAAVIGMFRAMDGAEFLRQLIGVLGLFDTVLRPSAYAAIGLLLAATLVSPLPCAARLPAALAAGITALVYGLAILLIFYVIWTPVHADQVWGVQGRYFVPILPLIAVVVSALVKRGLSVAVTCALAIACATISGAGTIDAILRSDWKL